MYTQDAISNRRSIRKFIDAPIPKSIIEKILQAGTMAPSPKNRQPWRFVVVDNEKQGMLQAMRKGIETEKLGNGLLPHYKEFVPGAEFTLQVMEQAPITVFVLNPLEEAIFNYNSMEQNFYHLSNIQSIGAAIENMLLSAHDLGLGSLWIGDINFAYKELLEWLDTKEQLVAAVSIGYADETPSQRPRKEIPHLIT
jgi:nitroreductase